MHITHKLSFYMISMKHTAWKTDANRIMPFAPTKRNFHCLEYLWNYSGSSSLAWHRWNFILFPFLSSLSLFLSPTLYRVLLSASSLPSWFDTWKNVVYVRRNIHRIKYCRWRDESDFSFRMRFVCFSCNAMNCLEIWELSLRVLIPVDYLTCCFL